MFNTQTLPENNKIKVFKQLESIKERPYDSDNNGSGQSSDKNEHSESKSGEDYPIERH